ncbi:unnamed protein product [Acanthoscelides obtectus]|uniref:Uncharacterized protein n=1 Tax=Acanthoscelides obtectus TaxID=200917 RepID=A0A9P0MBE2_ACAOB|nr:unnamed protein product [Acanthoscelides obtectus]CAK1641016.1 hypothetical protein AOBTE_LOCUS12083 [Acanthoscelides obtectus]
MKSYNLGCLYLFDFFPYYQILCLQVGSVPRSPPPGSAGTASSPDEGGVGSDPEAELLMGDGGVGGSSNASEPKAGKKGVASKIASLLKKLCSTHQFRNEQVKRTCLIKIQ